MPCRLRRELDFLCMSPLFGCLFAYKLIVRIAESSESFFTTSTRLIGFENLNSIITTISPKSIGEIVKNTNYKINIINYRSYRVSLS